MKPTNVTKTCFNFFMGFCSPYIIILIILKYIGKIPLIFWTFLHLLCILTSVWVLPMTFAGWNFFCVKTSYSVFFRHRKKRKKSAKNAKNTYKRGSSSIKVLLLNAGWHPKTGRLLGKIYKSSIILAKQPSGLTATRPCRHVSF